MIRKTLLYIQIILCLVGLQESITGQVSINTSATPPNPSSMLDIGSSSKGVLIPRMTAVEKDNISNPSHSLLLYQTDGISGFYYNSGTPISPIWIPLSSSTVNGSIRIPIDTLPFAIISSGSYYLTASLDASAGMDGITISASNVSIDLNGNGLIGDGTGTNVAIQSSGTLNHISIYNGFVSNWGGYGISLTSASSTSISLVKINSCGYSGFNLGQESLIDNCIATDNGLDGISTTNSSTVNNCSSLNNGSDGIDVGNYCQITNCNANSNGGNGLETSSSCQISNSIAYNNDDNGLYLGTGSTATGCTAASNNLSGFELLTNSKADNNHARSNGENGFLASNDASLTNNIADNNTLSGFLCDGSDTRLDNNQSTDNSQHGFNITGTGNVIIRNSSSGNISLAFNILAGNTAGTILTSATFNSNTNPYANIAF